MKKKHSAKFDCHAENFGLIRSDKIKQCQKTLYCHAEFISASSHRQAEMSNSQKLPLPAGSKGKQRGTSCVPLLAEQRGWGEELTSNSAPIKQLQKPNCVTSPVASIFGAQVCAPYFLFTTVVVQKIAPYILLYPTFHFCARVAQMTISF